MLRAPALLFLLLAFARASAFAAPDFSTSSISIEPAQPVEGDLVSLTLAVRNGGSDAASHVEVDLQLPVAGMFVDAGGPDAVIDLDARTVSWQASIDAGAMRMYTVRLILPRGSGGEAVLPTLRVRQLYTATEAWIHGEAEIGTRIAASGVRTGGLRLAPAGLGLVALLAAALGTWAVLRVKWRRTSSRRNLTAAVVAITIAVGFWMLFASMALHDWRVLKEYVAADCRVLDRRMRINTSTSPSLRRQLPQQPPTTNYEPLLALQYDVNGATVISTGFDTGSRVQIGSGARELESFERWPIGIDVPCWYDPRDPQQVVVIRGFGGAYFFALIPLPLFLFGIWIAISRVRSLRP